MNYCIHNNFMADAIKLAEEGVKTNLGGPFGAIIVKDNLIIGRGNNQVTANNDPTSHAEIVAIRNACKQTNNFILADCVMYTTCEPCPMCLGAIYWARISKVFYVCTKKDVANIGFDDEFIYKEITLSMSERKIQFNKILGRKIFNDTLKVLKIWQTKINKIPY